MNVLGLGVDAVDVARFERAMKRRPAAFQRRVFTEAEIAYCRARKNPSQHFAARWAAKEAFFKAIGSGWSRAGGFRSVEVARGAGGAPALALHGRARRLAMALGADSFFVSLSHGGGMAVAAVLAAGSGKGAGE